LLKTENRKPRRSMRFLVCVATLLVTVLTFCGSSRAGLYYSGEKYAELPSGWRGFLLDHRRLRAIAQRPVPGSPAGPLRTRYQTEAERLTKLAGSRKLTAEEAADLGALLVRLGDSASAVSVLRTALVEHPRHFHLLANLGTAWQMEGNRNQAAACLEQALRVAPKQALSVEQLHLKLIHLRSAPARGLDDLFGVRYVGPSGRFEPGQLAPTQRSRLPADAVAGVQQLALWLPSDGRLLWQLGELAGAGGDVATAFAILDICVAELGLRDTELVAHRQAYRAAKAEREKLGSPSAKMQHEGHAALFKPRSTRPLTRARDRTTLPAINSRGINDLPWSVVVETTLDRHFRPDFPAYLKELEGKTVQLQGYMQPLGGGPELNSFLLLEFPVGCWYCEQPEMTALVLVELPEGETYPMSRDPVKVRGRLTLNYRDPESFLYTLRDVQVVR
jgi:tetratricopeptide (TPR) repeat protein